MSEDAVWDREKGELRIFGLRHVAIDAQTLCGYLDSVVGVKVGEVIMHNIEFRLGKTDTAKVRAERPQSSLTELLEHLTNSDRLSGAGITKVTMPENPQNPIIVEIANPAVKGTEGAAKEFLVAWWAGAVSALYGKDFDVKNVAYDEGRNVLTGVIAAR